MTEVVYTRGQARLEGWDEKLSKRDLVEIIRQQDEVLGEFFTPPPGDPIIWMSQPGDVTTSPSRELTTEVGRLKFRLNVSPPLPQEPREECASVAWCVLTMKAISLKFPLAYTDDELQAAKAPIVFMDATKAADGIINVIRKSLGPDPEMIEMFRYLMEGGNEGVGLSDMSYAIRDRAGELEYEKPEAEQHQGSSWELPMVVKFGEAIKKIQEWIK